MRRDPLPWLLFLGLALLGGLAWLTAHPEGPALDRMVEWPWIGPAAARFRDLYRPPPAAAEPEVEYVRVRPAAPGSPALAERTTAGPRAVADAGPTILVGPGTRLYAEPARESEAREVTRSYANLAVRERRGAWYRVARAGRQVDSGETWVHEADVSERAGERFWQADPVLPLPASPPAVELLAAARELMADGGRETACGPYRLLTDAPIAELPESCARLASSLDRVYAERYGLEPAGAPAEAILIFRGYGAFLIFRSRAAPEVRHHAFAAPARGLVALTAQGRMPGQLEATLAHELVHLLNRRFLGPALPPWLDEGLASDLAFSARGGDGALLPGSLGGWQSDAGGRVRLHGGGRGALLRLQRRLAAGRLPDIVELLRLDQATFRSDAELHYALAAFWLRYLLSGEEPSLAAGLRSFLAAVAAGEPIDDELLLGRLGRGWPELEAGFRGWIGRLGSMPDATGPAADTADG